VFRSFDAAQFSFEDIGGSTCGGLSDARAVGRYFNAASGRGGRISATENAAAAESAEGMVVAMRYGAGTEFERPVKCFTEANEE
jgi:hypothetical protein